MFLVFLILLSGFTNNLFTEPVSYKDSARFFLDVLILAGIATLFFDLKTEEDLKWRWGRKK